MPTKLLNDDGTASMATMLMCSHHAFRRDVACLAKALTDVRHDKLDAHHRAIDPLLDRGDELFANLGTRSLR